MDEKTTDNYNPAFEKFLTGYIKSNEALTKKTTEANEKALSSVVLFEKVRAAVEYQEQHLVVKNTIARIIRRYTTLYPKIDSGKLVEYLVSELVWANYLHPDTIPKDLPARIRKILDRYLVVLLNARSGLRSKYEIQKFITNMAGCEIEDEISPKTKDDLIVDLAFSSTSHLFENKIKWHQDDDHKLQIRLAYIRIILKPDASQLQYQILKYLYPTWKDYSLEECKKTGKSLDPLINNIEKKLNTPLRNRYFVGAKRFAAPFIVLRSTLESSELTTYAPVEKKQRLIAYCMENYRMLKIKANKKVWTGIWRALIFILLTKLILAFIIEIPVDRWLEGRIHTQALVFNLGLPPLLMLIAGLSIPKIPDRNQKVLEKTLDDIFSNVKVDADSFKIEPKSKAKSAKVFNVALSIFTLVVFIGVVWSLRILHFNFVSIGLFFLFVSAVSFLSFRIRANSKELVMKRRREDSVTSFVELVFMPFIQLGKNMSDGLNKYNPIMLFLDFFIEAPFKTIVRIMRSWLNFISSKKEELEY